MMLKALVLTGLSAVANGQDLISALTSNSQLSQLASLVNAQPDLVAALGKATNITLLAPNNNALATLLNSSAGSSLATNPGAVAALLSYHVLTGTYASSQITNRTSFIPTLLTNTSYANVTGGQRVEALTIGGNATFFSGLNQNSTVVQANQNFTGGVIHVINRVLTLPRAVSTTLVEAKLTSLWGALNKAKLLNAVDGLKDVTIFAPSDSAFNAVGSALANVADDVLTGVLTYHVVNGSSPQYSTSLANGTTLKTLQGGTITVRVTNGTTFVNGAKVLTPDVLIAGGVVHVIDQLLNPGNASASASGSSGAPAFSGASSVSTIPFTSGVPTASSSFGAGAASATPTSGSSSSTSKAAAAQPMRTGAVGAAVLFGAGAVFANF